MNNILLTITLLIVIAANIAWLYLGLKIYRWIQTPRDIYGQNEDIKDKLEALRVETKDYRLILHEAIEDNAAGISQQVTNDGKLTRKDIQEVKTALRDDEKDDQKHKARLRQHKRHGGRV